MAEWSRVKVGDELAFNYGAGAGYWMIFRVTSILPNGRINCGPYTLNANMTVRGQRNYKPFTAVPATDQLRDAALHQLLLRKIRDVEFEELTTTQLQTILNTAKSGYA